MSNRLDRLTELYEKATNGPWKAVKFGVHSPKVAIAGCGFIEEGDGVYCHQNDADLIAEMHHMIPFLLRVAHEAERALPDIGSLFGDGRDLQRALDDAKKGERSPTPAEQIAAHNFKVLVGSMVPVTECKCEPSCGEPFQLGTFKIQPCNLVSTRDQLAFNKYLVLRYNPDLYAISGGSRVHKGKVFVYACAPHIFWLNQEDLDAVALHHAWNPVILSQMDMDMDMSMAWLQHTTMDIMSIGEFLERSHIRKWDHGAKV